MENKLTYKKQDGSFGVVGMNQENAEVLLFSCVRKLFEYEESELAPKEVLLLKQQYEDLGFKNKDMFTIAETTLKDKIDFAINKIMTIKRSLANKVVLMKNEEHVYLQKAVTWQDIVYILDKKINELKELLI